MYGNIIKSFNKDYRYLEIKLQDIPKDCEISIKIKGGDFEIQSTHKAMILEEDMIKLGKLALNFIEKPLFLKK